MARQVLPIDVHEHVARRIPQFVAEVPVALHFRHVETQVPALRRERCESQAQRIRAEGGNPLRKLPAGRFLDRRPHLGLHQAAGTLGNELLERYSVHDVERIDHVALGLGHLLAVVVADQAVHIHLAKRNLRGELEAQHDHAGDPEENDVEAGDQDRRRIISAQLARVPGPPLRGEGPQSRGEPGVEDVLVLPQRGGRVDAMHPARFGFAVRDVAPAFVVVPCRDPVSPPQLPADAPVLDVAHPFEIDGGPVFGNEANVSRLDGADRGRRERLDVDEPLVRQ